MSANVDLERRLTQIESTLPHLATKADLKDLEVRLTRWMVGLMLGAAALAATIAGIIVRVTGG